VIGNNKGVKYIFSNELTYKLRNEDSIKEDIKGETNGFNKPTSLLLLPYFRFYFYF